MSDAPHCQNQAPRLAKPGPRNNPAKPMTVRRPILITRPEPGGSRFAAVLAARLGDAAELIVSPIMQITPVGPVPAMGDARGVIFTSANAVRAYAAAGRAWTGPAYTVGTATQEAASEAGFTAQAAGQDADSLVDALARLRPATPLLHLRGRHARGDVAARLTKSGLPTRDAVVYDQHAIPLSAAAMETLQGTDPLILPLFSPRSAALLAAQPIAAPLHVAALSPAVADAFTAPTCVETTITERPDAKSMAETVSMIMLGLGELEARKREV